MKKLVKLAAPLLFALSVTAFAEDKPAAPAAGGDQPKAADTAKKGEKKGKGAKKGGKKKGKAKKEGDAAAPKAQ